MCQSYNRQYGTKYICVMPTNLYGPNDNFDLETSHVLPAMIRKFHLAKLAEQGDWKGIKKDEQKYGAIPQDIKQSIGYKISFSGKRPIQTRSKISVLLWGSGNPYREFLHVDDLADACVYLFKLDDKKYQKFFKEGLTPLMNIGCGKDHTIKQIAEMTAEVVGYEGVLKWDKKKPDGTPQKLLDISKIKRLGWEPKIDLIDGIENVYEWYLENTKVLKEN